jgi:hypothetical protein
MTKTKTTAAKKSVSQMLQASKHVKKALNDTWGAAASAPMFRKRQNATSAATGDNADGIRTRRVSLINKHAYKVAASGAAQNAFAVLQDDAKAVRVRMASESKRSPWLPSLSSGAIVLLENFLCAYAQHATENAKAIKDSLGVHKRISGDLMKAGYSATNDAVFSTSHMPRLLRIDASSTVKKPESQPKSQPPKERVAIPQ